MKKLVLAAALGGTLFAGAAIAGQTAPTAQPRAERHMTRLDTDQSGTISRAELVAAAEARFARRDADGDGQLSAAEMTRKHMRGHRRHHRGHAGMFKRFDANGDGMLTRDEAQAQGAARALKRFDRIDGNHDGRVDQAEVAQHRAERKAHRQERRAARATAAQAAGE
jgi:Ca2+-binding EF-hand superfamily protein